MSNGYIPVYYQFCAINFMRSVFTILLLFVSLPTLLFAQPVVSSGNVSTAFTHLTVIAVTGGRSSKTEMTVIVTGNRISVIGKTRKVRIPKNSQIIDATGKFLIPGLWDMHVHVLGQERIDTFLQLFIANGVTGIRDMGTTEKGFAILARLRREIANGTRIGTRIVAAGRILDGAEPVVPENSIPFTNETEARQAVRFLKQSGADFIKVYSGIPREQYFAIIDEAKKQSCSTLPPKTIDKRANALVKPSGKPGDFSHIPARIAESTRIALETYDEWKCQMLFAKLAKNKTWQVPTLATKRPLSLVDDGTFFNDARMKYITAADLEDWKPENNFFLKYRTPEFIVQKKRLYQKELELTGAMHKAGVPFMTGTDVPGAYTYPGFSLHDELGLLVQTGFTPLEALQAATVNPAKFLGLEKSLGTVEKGKVADLVLLDANPLDNIANTKRISGVVVGGRYLSKEKLEEMLRNAEAR